MADQVQNATKKAQDTATGAPNKVQDTAKGAPDKIQGYTSSIVSGIQGLGNKITGWGMGVLDRFFPPEKRAEVLARIQEFMLANPKLSTFLGMNIALTGVPLGLFILFSLTVAIFALIVGLVLGLLGAVIFIVFCVGIALAIVFPMIFFTTMTACFLFLWGLGGYYLLKWLNGSGDKEGEGIPLLKSGSIGDSINNLTGGKLTGFMDSAKAEQAKGDISGYSDQHTKPQQPQQKQQQQQKGQPNGSAQKQDVGSVRNVPSSQQVSKATKATGIDSVHKKAANTTGTVKGGLGGATGLT